MDQQPDEDNQERWSVGVWRNGQHLVTIMSKKGVALIIRNQKAIEAIRSAGKCGWCFQPCRNLEVHHFKPRGAGGASRIDCPENLMAVCNFCHASMEAGNIDPKAVLRRIAKREGKRPAEIREVLHILLRTPKEHASRMLAAYREYRSTGKIGVLRRLDREIRTLTGRTA